MLPVNRFSIILPVRNGGDYIKKCVESILLQTIPDFNLIILDSGSTDGTKEWIATLTDARIIFYPSDRPFSVEENWGRIKNIPRNEFMAIIGHDDYLHPNYLSVMKGLIDKYPDASLYATHFTLINESGQIIGTSLPMKKVEFANEFLEELLLNKTGAISLMTRSKDYDSIGGIPCYPGLLFTDFVLWVELTRISYKATAPENCLSYRLHSNSTTSVAGDERYNVAYELYIKYLVGLKNMDAACCKVINENAKHLILVRCTEFSKRLLGIKKKERKIFASVASLVRRHKEYADQLIDNNTFNPSAIFKIKMAIFLDSTAAGRFLFRQLKFLLKPGLTGSIKKVTKNQGP
jgi:glycosyltransferase involved in cell wall biosynthesis